MNETARVAEAFEAIADAEVTARGPTPMRPKGRGVLRPIHVVDAKGEVRRVATSADLLAGLLHRQGIEDAVVDGKRPSRSLCSKCHAVVKSKDHHGHLPKMCAKCNPSPTKGVCACGNDFKASKTGACLKCSRVNGSRKAWARKTPEQRSEIGRKARDAQTPEQRSEVMRKTCAARTPEQRSESARKQWASKTPEQRSQIVREMNASMSPEQRSDAKRKANQTRRAKAPPPSLEAVKGALTRAPGIGIVELAKLLAKRRSWVRVAVAALLEAGEVRDAGNGRVLRLHVVAATEAAKAGPS